jgi:ADP-ribose pyrophosphatase YjhB (NUDIX family)
MEYLQLFDNKRNMLNEKIARSEKYNVTTGKYFMVTLIFIENNEHKFLIQKTSLSKGGLFGTTGGHVTYGDTSIKTVFKETKEEIGYSIPEEKIKFVGFIKTKAYYCDIYYLNENLNIDDLVLQEEEVESINWYSQEEINDLNNKKILREGNFEPFQKVLKYIKTNINK